MSAIDLLAFGCGRLQPLGADRHRGNAQLLKAAKMRLKKTASKAGGGGGCCCGGGAGGWVPRCGQHPRGVSGDGGARGHRPGAAVPRYRWWGGERVSFPPARLWGLSSTEPPRSARRLGAWCFVGLGRVAPTAGRVPSVVGGAVHRRVVRWPEFGWA